MLQLQLQKIQILQESQALGRCIGPNDLRLIAKQEETLRELNEIRDNDANRVLMLQDKRDEN